MFYILLLIWAVFGSIQIGFAAPKPLAGHVLIFVLLLLLGWKVFGPPIHG